MNSTLLLRAIYSPTKHIWNTYQGQGTEQGPGGEEDDKRLSVSSETFSFTIKITEIHRQPKDKIQNGRGIKNELE